MERSSKRARLLDDEDVSDVDTGSFTAGGAFKINEEYALRHQHNAARTEKHQLEEKYKNARQSDSDSDSESESEDEGELATEELDHEIMATLKAIQSKDPKVYDKSVQFYKPAPAEGEQPKIGKDRSKPVHLRDYQRENLLNGASGTSDVAGSTHAQEQSALKQDLLAQIHRRSDDEATSDEDETEENFLVRKSRPNPEAVVGTKKSQPELDLAIADKDPEAYLSNFMASRAWANDGDSRFQPFESDEDDEDEAADSFEHAYNLRFEDPSKANETLTSHSRAAAEKYSVRRDEPKGRKKARQEDQARREARKQEREEEKARLRRLKVNEAQEKWDRLKEAAGLKRQNLPDDKLVEFLEKGFETDKWDDEMAKLLGEDYYNEQGDKPKWDDDIDIGDIVPEFDENEQTQGQKLTLSDGEDEAPSAIAEPAGPSKQKQRKEEGKDRANKKRQARLERRKIEELVDTSLDISLPNTKHSGFRYRETSPTTFGLSARDILMADDAQLNQYAGLKKLAAFREDEKKAKDKRRLGKKARLRQWRKETFGKDTSEKAKAGDAVADEVASNDDVEFETWFNKNRGIASEDNLGLSAPSSSRGKKDRGHNEERREKKKRKKSKSADVSS